MCGITGISLRTDHVHADVLKKATSTLNHRGPDSSNTYISQNKKTGLGHTRLSFIDLTASGSQPMTSSDGNIAVVLNGEIYNYLELREELIQSGFDFTTQTDTEVLIHGWKKWGEHLPEKLNGMFALAILDESTDQLFLARDRFGIKPLYYSNCESSFIFGSEIKSLLQFNPSLKTVRETSISLFLANRYIPTPFTIWKDIYKFEPGHSLTLDLKSFKMINRRFWSLKIGSNKISKEELFHRFHNELLTSVQQHLRSDVPIGSFLSGGLDSSALVYLMSKESNYPTQAFSIGFEDWDQSEHQFAQMVASQVGATLHTAKPKELHLNSVEKLMWHYDDPIADISIIPTFEVSGLARKYTKAVLSGEGADESLGGYWWHKPENFGKKGFFKNLRITKNKFHHIKEHYIDAMSMGLFDSTELKQALNGKFAASIPDDPFQHFSNWEIDGFSTLKQLQFLDLNTFMPELILAKVDRASMAHSLEVRVPFLQHTLVELLFSVDETSYFKPGEQKPLLQQLLKGNVPDAILHRPKQGFVGPDKYYMNMEVYRAALVSGRLVQDGVIKPVYIESKLQQKDHWRLWKLFVLENWWKNWM